MDWHAWLSKSSLHPSLAHEYAHLFSGNQLEEDDIRYLDHEFLLSMGVSIGKHRLEILKLARKERKGIASSMNKLRKRITDYVQMLARSSSSTAIVSVPKVAVGQFCASTATKSRKLLTAKKEKLMITIGNPAVHDCSKEGGGATAAVRWDSMFQNLKPT